MIILCESDSSDETPTKSYWTVSFLKWEISLLLALKKQNTIILELQGNEFNQVSLQEDPEPQIDCSLCWHLGLTRPTDGETWFLTHKNWDNECCYMLCYMICCYNLLNLAVENTVSILQLFEQCLVLNKILKYPFYSKRQKCHIGFL